MGAGAAGVAAAVALQEQSVGDEVCLLGAEGVVPYERPVLSKASLTDPLAADPPPLDPAGLTERGIRLELDSEVVSIDAGAHTLVLAEGREIAYDRLLLATGAEPRRLEVPGSQLTGLFYLRDLADARRLRPALHASGRVVIVGGGVIGLEVAASARRLGCDVTVVEAGPRLMGRVVPAELADAIAALHRTRGVTVRTSCRPVAFEGDDERVRGVVLADGEVLPADTVVIGIGVVPRSELAAAAGIATDDGILVDEHFRTSDDSIFAAGDVARVHHAGERRHVRIEQWEPAQEQGRCAAMSMLGAAEPYRAVPWMWSDQGEAHIQMAGFDFDDADVVVRRGSVDDPEGLSFLAVRDGRLVAACGVSVGTGVARAVRPAQRLIAREIRVDPEELGDPRVDLRRLVRQRAGRL
ncbi:MAG TPA: FAD-dependent oxidoreductase [Capillimicrobium sp.]|nr:FAD-dependent oxidoreductase [Capillimicrobium sp.]